jgi:hypothetical protein
MSNHGAGGTDKRPQRRSHQSSGGDGGRRGPHGGQPVEGTGVEPLKPDGVTRSDTPTALHGQGPDAPGGGDNGRAGAHGGQSAAGIGVEPHQTAGVVGVPPVREPTPPWGRGSEAPPGGEGSGVGAPPLGPPVEPSDSELRGYFFVIRGLRRKVG